MHSRHDAYITTRKARAAFEARFERLADLDGILEPRERARRAKHLRAAYFLELALKSLKARRERAHADSH